MVTNARLSKRSAVPVKSKGRGRPSSDPPRDRQVQMRITAREEALWATLVARLGRQNVAGKVTARDAFLWLLEEDARRAGSVKAVMD